MRKAERETLERAIGEQLMRLEHHREWLKKQRKDLRQLEMHIRNSVGEINAAKRELYALGAKDG